MSGLGSTFLDVVSGVLGRAGARPDTSPAGLVERWDSFVSECNGGFGWDYSEYVNELRSRDLLGLLLDEPSLQGFPELRALREEVARVDERFRALLNPTYRLPTGSTWWRSGVLAVAGIDYAEYMRDAYSIPVRTLE